jgi:hypothetical protein
MIFKRKPPVISPTPSPPAPTAPVATPAEAPVEIEWELGVATAQIRSLATALESREVEPQLIRARLADHYRDLEIEPMPPDLFDQLVQDLDVEAWRRMALAVGVLDHPQIRSALVTGNTPVAIQVRLGFVGLALDTDALTLSLLRQSDVRVEEFARQLAAHLDVAWRGESAQESRNRLEQLDYKRLLAEAERAKQQADKRMGYLRKQHEENMARRRSRGKH